MRRSFILICVALLLSAFANAQNYEIAVSVVGGGTIIPAGDEYGIVTVDSGESQSFTITANEHNRLVSVIVDGETNVTDALENGVYTFENVTANHTIAATFEAITYTITATAGEGGSITPSGAR